ncbi:MAG: gliding motility lipoprotein GldH [Tenuifilaceae bacterium]|jgi:gliding motility-associated lipoprotein GldH|nr:gliding motility lipoprotein GldH [Tenuifilaceae bacterium]
MNRIVFAVAVSIWAILVFPSCSERSVYNSTVDIPKETWSADSIATFRVNITDTTSVHNVYINLRNTTSYPNSNLYLFIQTSSPNGAMLRDTMECVLADQRGRWLGKGFGALRDNQIPYKRYIRFPEAGTYEFSIQQGMRTNKLKGIASVGIRIEKTKL